ncbi:MAG: hypothetical protein ACPMAQ_14860 [Phycisphaerae bacterium]
MFNARKDGMIRRGYALARTAIIVGGLLQAAACAPPAQPTVEQRLANTGAPALHAVFGEALQKDMLELNRLHSAQMRAELYTGNKFQPDMDQVAAAADSMAKAAARIPEALKGVQIDDQDRRVFLSLSDKLRREAVQLKQNAASRNYSAATATMERITATCNACHVSFRQLPGVPKTPS